MGVRDRPRVHGVCRLPRWRIQPDADRGFPPAGAWPGSRDAMLPACALPPARRGRCVPLWSLDASPLPSWGVRGGRTLPVCAGWRWDGVPTWLRERRPRARHGGRVSMPSPAPLRAYPFGEMISGCEPCPVGSLLSVKPRATRGLSRQSHPARGSRRHTSAWWTSAGAGPGQRVAPAHVLRVGSRAEGPAHAIPVTRAE